MLPDLYLFLWCIFIKNTTIIDGSGAPAFAGSVATFDRLVRNMINMAEVPLTDAIKMASKTPARILGLATKGELKAGYDADIVIFDGDINVKRTVIGGRTVFSAD